MSSKADISPRGRQLRRHVSVFAALGDETRLSLLLQLSRAQAHSISELAEGRATTRQAIAKHLRVLEGADLVHAETLGRERLYEMKPETLDGSVSYLQQVSRRWDEALERLRNLVEKK
jgi:DNA-binding transcriptional ArsR family regulator